MKFFIPIVFTILFICSASSQDVSSRNLDDKVFAEIENETITFKVDTTAFKKSISKEFFSNPEKETYNKIEIRKSQTFGEIQEDYYFVILYHFDKNLKTVRFLKTKNNKLFLSDESTFNIMYTSCVGKTKGCYPNVVVKEDLSKIWVCADEVVSCTIDSSCTIYRAILEN